MTHSPWILLVIAFTVVSDYIQFFTSAITFPPLTLLAPCFLLSSHSRVDFCIIMTMHSHVIHVFQKCRCNTLCYCRPQRGKEKYIPCTFWPFSCVVEDCRLGHYQASLQHRPAQQITRIYSRKTSPSQNHSTRVDSRSCQQKSKARIISTIASRVRCPQKCRHLNASNADRLRPGVNRCSLIETRLCCEEFIVGGINIRPGTGSSFAGVAGRRLQERRLSLCAAER